MNAPTFQEQLREERNARILAASRAGRTAPSIALTLGISRRTVYRVIAAAVLRSET